MSKRLLKFASISASLLMLILIWQFSESHYAYTEIEVPEAEEFDETAGLQLEIKSDRAVFVGATGETLDFNRDGNPDIIIADERGLSIYTNARGTEDFVRGPFLSEGRAVKLENGFSFMMGQDLSADGDLDLIVISNPVPEYTKEERVSTITKVGADYIEDSSAVWSPGSLDEQLFRPNVEQEKTFKILYNGIAEERGHASPFIQVDLSAEGEAEAFAELAKVGNRYGYQAWTRKDTEAPKLQVFLNGGNADFSQAQNCPGELDLPVGTVVTRMEGGNFNSDPFLDIALFVSTGTTGQVSEYAWTAGTHGRQTAFASLRLIPEAFAKAYDGGERFSPPFRATFKIKDPSADFAALAGQQNLYIVPDISKTYAFPVSGVGVDNGIQYVEGEVELNKVSTLSAGEIFMEGLTLAGRTYAIRSGEAEPIFLKGLAQEGCFQIVESISGEVFEFDYRSTPENPTTGHRSFFRDPAQNFLPEDSLAGWRVSFHRKGEEIPDESYEIAHNSQNTIYLFPEAGRVPVEDLLNDGNPHIYVLEPPELYDPSQRFAYSENLLEPNKISSLDLPAQYIRHIKNLNTVGIPVRAAFADFDGDGDLDFIYANGNLFYKENKA